jgi:hypothetical protein
VENLVVHNITINHVDRQDHLVCTSEEIIAVASQAEVDAALAELYARPLNFELTCVTQGDVVLAGVTPVEHT